MKTHRNEIFPMFYELTPRTLNLFESYIESTRLFLIAEIYFMKIKYIREYGILYCLSSDFCSFPYTLCTLWKNHKSYT